MSKITMAFATVSSVERKQLAELRRGLSSGQFADRMPASVLSYLKTGIDAMARGRAVAVVPVDAELTTEDAARLLLMSRTHLVTLLGRGEIPFHKTGNRRKLLLQDVLSYRESLKRQRRAALEALVADAAADGLYDRD